MAYSAALYCRLSKDDDTGSESASISTQKEMLTRFANEQGYIIYDLYIDDGYSGTNFQRPDFIRMKNDIESGMVNMVITKDLSRLGRDYIISGQLIEEYFPQKKVRYIAITDGVDSDNKYNDIAPFKNVINEMYARDISKKIKSAFETKMKEGKFIGNFAPYGYEKSPDNKNLLIINPETAIIVKIIFDMAKESKRPIDIANYLNYNKISSPAVYRCQKNPKLNIENYSKRKEWTSANIQKMLKNIVYIGNMAQHKTIKPSFKSNITIQNDKKNWIIVENTHEAIIDKSTFDMVQKIVKTRKNPANKNFRNVFSGIAKCSDCGCNMSTTGSRKKGSAYNLVCGKYKLYGNKGCTNHFINYDILYKIVLTEINKQLKLNDEQKQNIINQLNTSEKKHRTNETSERIYELNKRLEDINIVERKLYENYYLTKISIERFDDFLKKYETEKSQIEFELKALDSQIKSFKDDDYKSFYSVIEEMTELKELDAATVQALIDSIIIYQGNFRKENSIKCKEQRISINFKFINNSI